MNTTESTTERWHSRIALLFTRSAIPAWFLLGWRFLGHASTAQLFWAGAGKAYTFLDKHTILLAILGFGWLSLVVVWPDLKKLLPDWSFPKTSDEKIRAVYEALGESLKGQNIINDLLSEADRVNSDAMSKLSDDRTAAIQERSALRTRIADLERALIGADNRLDEHRPWISELESRLKALEKWVSFHPKPRSDEAER